MAIVASKRATLDDLYREKGKAELIGGRIVKLMATGRWPHRIAFRIARSLDDHASATGHGEAFGDNMGFAVPMLTSGRQSFSPDAAYYNGPLPSQRMRFIEGPPTFAVEVRSESDYGEPANREYEDKRADYFEAGTLVVWDVDPIAETIACHRPGGQPPANFCRGEIADAEPAVPGWRVPCAILFAT